MNELNGKCHVWERRKNFVSSLASFSNSIASSEVSASELSYLRAEVWSLQNRLRDEKSGTDNLIESFKKLANEKYELLDELTKHKQMNQQMLEELSLERLKSVDSLSW